MYIKLKKNTYAQVSGYIDEVELVYFENYINLFPNLPTLLTFRCK